MIKIISNGSKWAGEKPDTIEDLKRVLKNYALDPTFENYGNFINDNPKWIKEESKEKYKNCAVIFGNFLKLSHVFNIITDDKPLIEELRELIDNNKLTVEYINAKSNKLN